MKKKKPKHPKDMTSDELMRNLFHPDIIEHIKRKAQEPKKKRVMKKG